MDTITEERSVILSDGRVVQVRPGKGRDMLEAGRRAGVDVTGYRAGRIPWGPRPGGGSLWAACGPYGVWRL